MIFELERREAIDAGNRALISLEAASRDLKSARNWGLWDMFSSRSMFVSMIKHGKMQAAQQHMDQARYDLNRFSRELRDVDSICSLQLNVGSFLSFADVFWDNFFVDWAVQSRIAQALQQVNQAISMVHTVLDQLNRM